MPKIFDCFTFFNELDLLEVRLSELSSVVDKFVLVEATRTFQGEPKSLVYAENKDRFKAYQDKIIHIVAEFPDVLPSSNHRQFSSVSWEREIWQRNQIARGLASASGHDFVIVSDLDEILNKNVLKEAIAHYRPGDLTIFEMPMYAFYANRLWKGPLEKARDLRWLGPRMVRRRDFTTAQSLRMAKPFYSRRARGTYWGLVETRIKNFYFYGLPGRPVIVRNAGWHFTSLQGWEKWKYKVDSYNHKDEYSALPAYQSIDAFHDFVRSGTRHDAANPLPVSMIGNPKFPIFEASSGADTATATSAAGRPSAAAT